MRVFNLCAASFFFRFLRDVSVPNFLFCFLFLFSLPLCLLAFPFPGFLCLLAFLARNHLNFVLFLLCLWLTLCREVNILCPIFTPSGTCFFFAPVLLLPFWPYFCLPCMSWFTFHFITFLFPFLDFRFFVFVRVQPFPLPVSFLEELSLTVPRLEFIYPLFPSFLDFITRIWCFLIF